MSEFFDDNRYPGTATVYIEAGWGNQVASGSGAIMGNNDVLTASHVIYSKRLGGRPDWIRVYPSYHPEERAEGTSVFYEPLMYQYFTEFDPDGDNLIIFGDRNIGSKQGAELDLALLSFNQDIGKKYGRFGWISDFSYGPIQKLGYPSKYGRKLVYDNANLEYDPIDNSINIFNKLEVNPGDSGGPLYGYFYNEKYPRVVGVVSTKSAATGIKGHYDWLERMTDKNDDLIGKQKANFLYSTGSTDRLSGVRENYNQYIFSKGTTSTWSSNTLDAIMNYRAGDHISFNGLIYNKDIKKVDKSFRTLTNRSLRSTAGKFSIGSNQGVSVPKNDPNHRQWLRTGKKYFEPYEINAMYIRSTRSTLLIINDGNEGFDMGTDLIIQLVDFKPSRRNPITII